MPFNENRRILAARRAGDQVELTLDNGTRRFDHVMLATGYRIDVDRSAFLQWLDAADILAEDALGMDERELAAKLELAFDMPAWTGPVPLR